MTDERDLTAEQVAERLQVHRETVRVWARRGEFPHAYILPGRGGLRIPLTDLEAFIQRRRLSGAE